MECFGLQRKLEELGRIVIPSEYRKALGFEEQEYLEMFLVGGGVLIKKPTDRCKLCNNSGDLINFKDYLLCFECVKKIKATII